MDNTQSVLLNEETFFFPLWVGQLDSSDGSNPTRPNHFFDDFLLSGVLPGTQVQIDLAANEDSFLQLIDQSTGEVVAFDDDSGPQLNARLRFTVQPNISYIVRTTTFAPNIQTPYTLSTNLGAFTPATLLRSQQSVSASLSMTDFPNPLREGRVYDGYLPTDLTPGEIVIFTTNAEFDAYLQLIDRNTGRVLVENDDDGFGLNPLLSTTVEAGVEYLLLVTSFEETTMGNYTLVSQTIAPDTASNTLIGFDPYRGNTSFAPALLNSAIDGSNNNLLNPSFGMAGTPLRDAVTLDYANGFSTPAGPNRPNTRIISNEISQQNRDLPEPQGATNLTWVWGQFLDHDISLTPDTPEAAGLVRSIPIPIDDPVLNPSNVISLRESEFIDGTGTSPSNPRRLPNEITHWIDGSNVYGSSEAQANALRAFVGGQLLMSEGNLLPITSEFGRPEFVAGDVRANENAALTSMHTLFVREHNRLAQLLEAAHPDWNDEELYQRARQINIAQIQNITFNEYLPTLLGQELPAYEGYNSQINPNIERVFSNAAFRLGHTQLSSVIPQLNIDGTASGGNLLLRDVFFPGVTLLQEEGIDGILRGIASSKSQRVDNQVIPDVRSFLFGEGPNSPARDLVAINIERGRLNGLADYNTVRESYGLSRVQTFAEITTDLGLQNSLQELYGTVNNIDAFVGLLAEDLQSGRSVGETLRVILEEQFLRLRDGDRFYFENSLLPEEAALVRQTTLSDIIRRNTDTIEIQDNAFSLTNVGTDSDDMLSGGLGEDLVFGNGGDDMIRLHAADDNAFGGSGDDVIRGGTGSDRIFGSSGNDRLIGDAGHDTLVGSSGADVLNGTNSSVRGLQEQDVLTGGGGSDRFILGDRTSAYYLDGHPGQFGFADFASITDLDLAEDVLQLHGSINDYQLERFSAGSGRVDIQILYTQSSVTSPELIAILENVSPNISLDSPTFEFV